MLFLIFFSLFILFLSLETLIFLYINDFSLPTVKLPTPIKKILVVYPHPDDEILINGGFIKRYSKDVEIHWIVLTKGERGTPGAVIDENLKIVRTEEAKKITKLLCITKLEIMNFGDGTLTNEKVELRGQLQTSIESIQPDLIITYDLAGLYGHPDHIVASEIITDIARKNKIKLWYSSLSKRVLDALHLPEHMAKEHSFKKRRVYPTHKVYVGLEGTVVKCRGVAIYQSQKESFKSGFPVRWIPMPIYILPAVYEYYHEVPS